MGDPVGSLARASVSAAFRPHPAPAYWIPAGLARQVCCRCRCPRRDHLLSGIGYYAIVLILTGLTMLPYLADRLITPRLGGFVATLVFPLAFTMFEYLSSFGPSGTINSIANTQYGNLPLLQVVSVTGIWGLTFLITWFAAVVNWAWEQALCLASGARRWVALCCHPGRGALGWGRTAGALPAASDPGPRRGSQCFAGGGRRVQQAIVVSDRVLAALRQGHPG